MVAAWLAARHAQDQETIADNLALGLFPLWQIMDFNDLNGSAVLWLEAALPRVELTYLQSQRLATVFNANVRFAELPLDEPIFFDVPEVQFPSIIPASSVEMPELAPAPDEVIVAPAAADEVVPAVPGVARVPASQSPFTPQWVLDRIKHLEDVAAGRVPRVELKPFNRSEVAQSLTIEASYNTKAQMPGPEDELMSAARVRSSQAAVRQAMNGGRSVTNEVMKTDKKVIGYARVTDEDPCAFCALLASRGAVYGKGSFIGSDKKFTANEDAARDLPAGWTNVAKVHNNCRCHLRPVYSKKSLWDAGAQHFLDVWNEDPTLEDIEDVLRRTPNLKGTKLALALYKRRLKRNPFQGNQFDLNTMRRDLRDRADGLVDAGFSPNSPQVQWADKTAGMVA